MIEHLRSNKGKNFLYVLPVKKGFDNSEIVNYIVCIVKIINIYNKRSEVKILNVINENKNFPYQTFLMKKNKNYFCSNKYLYNLSNEIYKN